jgi:O-antigen ligase
LAAAFFGWKQTSSQWAGAGALFGPENVRLLAARATLKMLPDAGAWGLGPGCFAIAFPHYTMDLEDRIAGVWTFAHNDYLQTAAEWGWFGAATWSVLLFGGICAGIRSYRRSAARLRSMDRVCLFTSLLALVGVALHALVDFPLQIASLQLYTAVYLGAVWGSRAWQTD